jgi:hypothetical protein
MAIQVMLDVHVLINGVLLSDHGSNVTLGDLREKKDITGFGAGSRVWTKGLGDATMTVTFFQDFAAGKIHATLQPLIGSSTPVTVEVRPTSAARSTTNPAYVMSALLFDYSMLDGGIGEPSTLTVEFSNASQAGVTYPTA